MATDSKKNSRLKEICPYCGDPFNSKEKMNEHIETCIENPKFTGVEDPGLMDLSGLDSNASKEEIAELADLQKQLMKKRTELAKKAQEEQRKRDLEQQKRMESGYLEEPVDEGLFRLVIVSDLRYVPKVLNEQKQQKYQLLHMMIPPRGVPYLFFEKPDGRKKENKD